MIVVPILILIVVGTVGNAIHPVLVKEHPLWLVGMEPRNRWVILVADKVSFWPLLVVGTLRRLASDPLFYLLGYLYGDNAVRWAEKRFDNETGMIRGVERIFAKAAPVLVFLFPGALVCVLAGAAGMNPIVFAVLNVVGTLFTVFLLYKSASVPVIKDVVDAINGFYSRNFKWLTAVSLVLTVIYVLWQFKKGDSDIQSVSSIEKELEGDPQGAEAADPDPAPPAS